ncbi:hypothetical protein [Micromonospora ureilytica]|uniref:hypothetical protein n=2 Tax=Micromonospora ureilytica TaxID=709868 RepID=UPI002E0F4CD4|nr:hypothetical protein OHB55_15245 [Micromonospora ureilytica]
MVVDWSSLRAASGRATALPAAISRLDADAGEQAFRYLAGEVAPQGALYEAAPWVAAEIVGVLAGWSAVGQTRGLRVLAQICVAGAPSEFTVRYQGETVALETASHRAVQDSVPVIATLLTATEPEVRRAAMNLLSLFSIRAAAAEAALAEAAESAADPAEREELREAIKDLHEWNEEEDEPAVVDPALLDLAARRKLTWRDDPDRTRLGKPSLVWRVRAGLVARLARHLR